MVASLPLVRAAGMTSTSCWSRTSTGLGTTGNLTVNTLNGNKPANAFKILTYRTRVNNFASFTYLGGVTYTPDPQLTEYDLKP